MRLIDSDKIDFNEVFIGQSDFATDTRNAAKELIDIQQTVITGNVKESKIVCHKTTAVKPIEHHYEDQGEEPYIKYSCPVCQALGNLHQVTRGDKNCPLCNVNLCWETDN